MCVLRQQNERFRAMELIFAPEDDLRLNHFINESINKSYGTAGCKPGEG
jgi:hypothetical protein